MFISDKLLMTYLCIKQLLKDAWLLYEQVYYYMYKLSS